VETTKDWVLVMYEMGKFEKARASSVVTSNLFSAFFSILIPFPILSGQVASFSLPFPQEAKTKELEKTKNEKNIKMEKRNFFIKLVTDRYRGLSLQKNLLNTVGKNWKNKYSELDSVNFWQK
jgi:hypothetical protein